MKKFGLFGVCLMLGLSLAGGKGTVQAAADKQNLSLANGASYYGEVQNGLPNGRGTIRWSAQKSYSGDWVDGKRSGNGTYVLKTEDGAITIYKGNWANDRMNGKGLLTIKNAENQSYFVDYGTFQNNAFAEGYEVGGFSGIYIFDYEDAQKQVGFTVYENANAEHVIKADYAHANVFALKSADKQKDGSFKGFDYNREPESIGTSFKEGSWDCNEKMINGVSMLLNEEDWHTYKSVFVNGKKVSTQKLGISADGGIMGMQDKIDRKVSVLTPYLKGFKTVYDAAGFQSAETFK